MFAGWEESWRNIRDIVEIEVASGVNTGDVVRETTPGLLKT